MATAHDLLAEANKWVAAKYREGNNNDTVFGRWYGANHVAWCAMFVSYCLNKSGNGKLIAGAQTKKGFSLCSAGIRHFKKKKAWHSARDAKPGDIVFFDWNHNGDPDHVGIVYKNDPKRRVMTTIEGNTSAGVGGSQSNGDGVFKRTRPYSLIIGVGRPDYDNAEHVSAPVEPAKPAEPTATPVEPAKPADKPATAPKLELKLGSKGAAVKTLQKKLGVTADGDFGPKTRAAVIAFQKKHALTADGIVGANTWKALG